jgi:hypothetical protein
MLFSSGKERVGDYIKWKAHEAHRLLESIKKEYGLVPAENESVDDFVSRADKTINGKCDPSENIANRLLSGKKRKNDTTDEVKQIISRYLGINNATIDASEGKIVLPWMKGFALEESDGSAVLATEDMPDNTSEMVSTAARNLENLLESGIPSYSIGKSKNFTNVYWRAGMKLDSAVDMMFCEMNDQAFANETFLKLHEGIHANHLNNHSRGRRKEDNPKTSSKTSSWARIALNFTPFINNFYRFKTFNFAVESETMAYMVGMEEFYFDILDRAAARLSMKGKTITGRKMNEIKQQFRDNCKKVSEAILHNTYLNNPLNGYGTVEKDYSKALFRGAIGYMFYSSNSHILQGIGALMLISAASHTMKIPFAAYFERKVKNCVKIIGNAVEKYGKAGAAFYETLGMSMARIKDANSD